MSIVGIASLVVVVGFAFMLGVSDAPNASAVLIASRTASYRRAMAFSFAATIAGGLLAGDAVARTMMSLVHVTPTQLPLTYLAGGVAAVAFTIALTRRGIPTSASIALVGGLAGAAVVHGGWRAVGWGGLHGLRSYGVIGSLLAMRRVEHDYRTAMAEVITLDDLRAAFAAQDIYRRYLAVAQSIIAVADRLWFVVLRGA